MKKAIILCAITYACIGNTISAMFLRRATLLKNRAFSRMCTEKNNSEVTASFNYDDLLLQMQVKINQLTKENQKLIKENEKLQLQTIENQYALTDKQETIDLLNTKRDNRA